MGWRDTIAMVDEEKEIKKVRWIRPDTVLHICTEIAALPAQTIGGKEVTEKKTWSYWHLSDYKWLSYKE